MQPEQDPNEQWRQPSEVLAQAPFQAVTEPEVGDVQAQPSEQQPEGGGQPLPTGSEQSLLAGDEPSLEQESQGVSEDDATLIRWEAPEHTDHDQGRQWYIIFAVVTLVAVLVAIFLIKSVTFAILIPVMAVALFIYTRRPPEVLQYTLSRKGLYINARLYPYGQFKSFGVLSHTNTHSAVLVPRKRFQIGQTIYFPEEIGEQLVDMLASRLPMKEIEADAIDRLLARLHL